MKAAIAEAGLFFAALGATAALARRAVAGVLSKAARIGDGEVCRAVEIAGSELKRCRTPAEVLAAADQAILFTLGALLLLGLARVVSARRGSGGNILAPLILPLLTLLVGLGLALQLGYGDPVHRPGFAGPPFGLGVLVAASLGAVVLLVPGDPARWAHRLRWPLAAGLGVLLLALVLFGKGPKGSEDVKINLGPIQPLEAAKLGFVLLLGPFLGRRAAKLRFQRERLGLLRWPRPRLLLPAIALLLALQALMFAVKDLGPVVVLSAVFLTCFFVVTRSRGFVVLAVALVGGLLTAVLRFPELVTVPTVGKRIAMWSDPWLNALPGGDQLGRGLWAYAAGGMFGQGLGAAPVGLLPAGHNDMAIAQLGEELGFVGVAVYLCGIAALVISAALVAARSRTPDRALLATGLGALLGAQTALIFAGSTGLFPLTGIVAPYLSAGRSSLVAFVVLAALLLRLAEGGAVRADTDELRELRGAARSVALVAALLAAGACFWAFRLTVELGPAHTARSIVIVQGDGTVPVSSPPRIEAILQRIHRGALLDREGQVLAGTNADGARTYPLGAALGTLLGPPDGGRLRPVWALERLHDARLRGYRDAPDGPAVWLGAHGTGERVLFAVPSGQERPLDRARAELLAGGGAVRLRRLPSPDRTEFARLARLRPAERERAVEQLNAAVMERSVSLTLDADLQKAVAQILVAAAKKGKAAAAVVIDVATGEVLARAQVPDLDLTDGGWQAKLDGGDPAFLGAYGPWPDKTGLRGFLQAGSIAKVFTALAAARRSGPQEAEGCVVPLGLTLPCTKRDADGPYFTRPSWGRPVHDYAGDRNHGVIGLVEATEVSCNVYFGQLGLELGPEAFRELAAAGAEIGWSETLDPGVAGSRRLAETAFGQGAAALSPMQAARLIAAVGDGGRYRRCPGTMERGEPCATSALLPERSAVLPLLAGLRAVITEGTGDELFPPKSVRLYGKTGTADAPGLAGEAPYGVRPGDTGARSHSWFVALAEPIGVDACAVDAPGRLAIAVAVARGGFGGAAAGPAAVEIVRAAVSLGYLGEAAP